MGTIFDFLEGYKSVNRRKDFLLTIQKIKAAGGTRTPAGRKMMAENFGSFNRQDLEPDAFRQDVEYAGSDIFKGIGTEGGREFFRLDQRTGELGGTGVTYPATGARTVGGVVPGSTEYDRISKRVQAIGKALETTDEGSEHYANLQAEQRLLQDQVAAAHGKQITRTTTPGQEAVPETREHRFKDKGFLGTLGNVLTPQKTVTPGEPAVEPRTEITWEDFISQENAVKRDVEKDEARRRRGIGAASMAQSEGERRAADIMAGIGAPELGELSTAPQLDVASLLGAVTEQEAPSQAAAAQLKQQPIAARQAISDARIAGLTQQQATRISTDYGADALGVLAGLSKSEKKSVLALMEQIRRKQGTINKDTRAKIRKMLGLKYGN